ncbi:DUF5991 domain-containing protein [Lutispora sp.]|uniref:DUF5991 domain-containing protein n=1 Tax=Lutispora sp. TaxID=2828727 RepID=UPI003567902E
MNILKKLIIYIIICVSAFSLFVGCSKTHTSLNQLSESKPENTPLKVASSSENVKPMDNSENDRTEKDSATLESWVGNYIFSEYAPPDQNMFYTISIYKENNEYYAEINIDGFQTIARLMTKVSGNEKSIKLIFEKYLPDNQFELYNEGDILLSFEKSNSDIYTSWGKIQPMIQNNNKSGKVYFTIE